MISIINSFEDQERFLYGDNNLTEMMDVSSSVWINNVEKALGFRLFSWQKMMIAGLTSEYGRRTGKSLTWALMRLRSVEPVDMRPVTMYQKTARQRCNYKLLEEVAAILDSKNVPHAPVCKSEKEFRKYEAVFRKVLRGNGRHPQICIMNDNV